MGRRDVLEGVPERVFPEGLEALTEGRHVRPGVPDAAAVRVPGDGLPGAPRPARAAENTCPQWSRPPLPLIFGVRPNSPIHTTSVEPSRPRASRSSRRAEQPWSIFGIRCVFRRQAFLPWVSQAGLSV